MDDNVMTPEEARAEFVFLNPYEIKGLNGKRGVAVALIGAELFAVTLRDGERWTKHPLAGIVIAHPFLAPVWCRFEGYTYIRSALELH